MSLAQTEKCSESASDLLLVDLESIAVGHIKL
jgi:hypothetical protein